MAHFIARDVEPWEKTEFETTVPNSWFWYRCNFGVIRKYPELASLPLDKITADVVLAFKTKRIAEGYAIGTINSTLRVLRSCLRRAALKYLDRAPEIELFSKELERRREHVVRHEEERQYLRIAEREDPEMGHVIISLVDTRLVSVAKLLFLAKSLSRTGDFTHLACSD